MFRFIVGMFVVFAFSLVASGQVANCGRIDLSGTSGEIELDPREGSCGKFAFGTWQKPEDVKRYLTMDLDGKAGEWKLAELSFTPLADGRIMIILLGPAGGKSLGVCYRDIRANGVLLWDGTVEDLSPQWRLVNKADTRNRGITSRIVTDQDGGLSILAWHNAPARSGLDVKKGVPVTISLMFKPAGDISQPANEYFPLNISKAANMGFADEMAGDGKGGWTDQGPANDLRTFTPESGFYAGYPFHLIDPVGNSGKSCVILNSSNSRFGSAGFTLPVHQTCNRIALLTGAAWAGKGERAANVTVEFADGSRKEFSLITGKNIGEWWNPVKQLPEADLAWSGANNKNLIGLFCSVIKWEDAKEVKSITIKPVTGNSVVLGIVGVTAAMIRVSESEVDNVELTVNLKSKAKLIALPVDFLKMDMREKNLPADPFFDEFRGLKRICAFDSNGTPLTVAIAKYSRKLAPVILVRSEKEIDAVTLKLDKEEDGKILSPAKAFVKIAGDKTVAWNDAPWANGIVLQPSQAKTVKAQVIRNYDSLYQQTISFEPMDSEVQFEFELKKPETVKLFSYMSHPTDKSQSNRVRVQIDGGETIVVGGVFYKSLAYYWTGGQRVKLDAGKHKMTLSIQCKPEERKGLEVGKFYLGFDYHAPEPSGFADEMGALKTAGFEVYGYPGNPIPTKDIPSDDWLCRIVNADHSYPDLSSLVNNRIDRDGYLQPDGKEMRFSGGVLLPYIWGRNIGTGAFYRMWKKDRIGGPDGDGVDRLFKRYKSLGISALRVFYDSMPRADWTNIDNVQHFLLDGKTLTFHPDFAELYQRMIAAAHRNGIYLSITFGHFPWSLHDISDECQSMFYNEEMLSRQKQRIKNFLDTPNPYRGGIRPADDPTILILEIENECNFRGTGLGRHHSWLTMTQKDKGILYPIWHDFLRKKYKTFAALKKHWGDVPLKAGAQEESFDNIEFAPVWDVKEWGRDESKFTAQMDDLRISSASFGKNMRSNPVVSDGFEFMYEVYSQYLKEMYAYLRSLGYRGIITTCGPDTEHFYLQRAAANEVVDAVSGGTGYWNRTGYGFLQSLSWMDALVHASSPNKPMISREYGANLAVEDSWWGNLINAAVQKAMGKAYLFDFAASIPGPDITPDYLYPEDAHEQRRIDLLHEMNFYSTMSNTAAAIAVQSDELKKPEFRLDIADSLDNVFYAASFRGYNKMTFNDYTPFLYTDSNVRTFRNSYDGNADLVVNEPSIPAGDYGKAKRTFLTQPHSSFDRHGHPNDHWFKGKIFQAEGFIDQQSERDALYDAIISAGGKMPITKEEYCKIWRDAGRKLEIDTARSTFRGDTSTWGAFIGNLKFGKEKAPRQYTPEGSGDAWTFFGKIPEYDLFMAVMNGKVNLNDTALLRYMMLGSSYIDVTADGKRLVSVLAGSPVNIALKCDNASLLTANKIDVTFFRSKSCQLPARVTFGRKIRSVEACNRDGKSIADIHHKENSFENQWTNGHMISFYRVTLE